jgi:hypothetical protein
VRYEQLNLVSHYQLYQKRMVKVYNKKVRPRVFQEIDLVLRKILALPTKTKVNGHLTMKAPTW